MQLFLYAIDTDAMATLIAWLLSVGVNWKQRGVALSYRSVINMWTRL